MINILVVMSESPQLEVSEEVEETPGTSSKNETITLSLSQLKELLAEESKKNNNDYLSHEQGEVPDQDDLDEIDEPLSSDEETDNTAPSVDSKLADFVDNRLVEPQPADKLKIKFDKATRPENVCNTQEVRINKTLFKSLPVGAKKRDIDLRKIHSTSAKAINNITKVADMIVKKGKEKGQKTFTEDQFKEMHSNVINGLGLMCQASQKINARRVRISKI